MVKQSAHFVEKWSSDQSTDSEQTYVEGSLRAEASSAAIVPNITGLIVTSDGIEFDIENFGEFDKTTVITITYQIEIDPVVYTRGNSTTLKAATVLTAPDTTVNENYTGNSKKIDLKWISQIGILDRDNKKIAWTVTINESNIDMYHAEFSSEFGEFLTLDETEGIMISKDGGNFSSLAPTTTTGDIGNGDVTGFTYVFSADSPLNKIVKITYTTAISDDFFLTNGSSEFNIGAKLNWGDTVDTGSAGNYSKNGIWEGNQDQRPNWTVALLTKSAMKTDYNASTGEIIWTIKVKPEDPVNQSLDNVVVIDTIPKTQIYVPNSAVSTVSTAVISYNDSTSEVRIELGNITGEETITLKTKIPDQDLYKNIDGKYSNTASVTANSNGSNVSAGLTAECPVGKHNFLVKTGKYNPQNHVITWTVNINESKLPIREVKISDALSDKVTYVPGSFSMTKLGDTKVSAPCPGETAGISNITYDFNVDGNSADGRISDNYVMEYQTEVTDLSIFDVSATVPVYNEVILTGKAEMDKDLTIEPDYVDIECSDNINVNVPVKVVRKYADYVKYDTFIKWRITVNEDQMDLADDAVIIDSFASAKGDLALDPSDMRLVKGKKDANGNWIKDAKGNWNGDEITVTEQDFSYDQSTKTLKFFLPDHSTDAYQLYFTTNVTDKTIEGSFQVENTVTFQNGTKAPQTDKITQSVSMPYGSISGTTPVGTLDVELKDKDNNAPLKGAEYELWGKFNTLIGTAVTDENGKLTFPDLKLDADYTLQQSKPAAGYEFDSEKIYVMIPGPNKNTETKTLIAKKCRTDFSFKKVAEKAEGEALDGAEFALYETADVSHTNLIKKESSGNDGMVHFNDIPYGEYTIIETLPSDGYKPSSAEIKVTMAQDPADKYKTVVTLSADVFINSTKVPGSITLTLVDKDTKKVLEGGAFEILGEDGVTAVSGVTDAKGKIKFSNLLIQKYTIEQTAPPMKYVADTKIVPVILKVRDRDKSLTVENTMVTALISLNVSSSTREGVMEEGAEFALYQASDTGFTTPLLSAVSDKNGNLIFANMKYGDYVVRQKSVAAGYQKSDFTQEVSIKDDTERHIDVKNAEITGNIKVTLKQQIYGIEYTLFDREHNKIEAQTTDAKGEIIFKDLLYGEYQVSQTGSHSDYNIDTANHKIEIRVQDETKGIEIDKIPVKDNGPVWVGPYVPPKDQDPAKEEAGKENSDGEEPSDPEDKKPDKKKQDKKKPKKKKPSKDKTNKSGGSNNSDSFEDGSNSNSKKGSDRNGAGLNNNRYNSDKNGAVSSGSNRNSGNTGSKTPDSSNGRLPQAGSPIDFAALMSAGIASILIGVIYEFKKKRR